MAYETDTTTDSQEVLDDCPPPSYGNPEKCTKDHANKCREWLRKGINYQSAYVRRQRLTDRKADMFFAMKMHLVPSFQGLAQKYTPHLTEFHFDRDDPDYVPLTTYDEFSGPLQNESARLGRPEYQAYVRPEGENPGVEQRTGAKIAKAAVRQSLKEMRWEETQERGVFHMPSYGQWWLFGGWDASWEETTRIPVLGAMKCPECDFKLASPNLSKEQADPFMDRVNVEEKPNPKEPGTVLQRFSTDVCLTCDEHTETEPQEQPMLDESGLPMTDPETGGPQMTMLDVEVKRPGPPSLTEHVAIGDEMYEEDHFGQPLGEDVPLGRWVLETLTPDKVFVKNHGIGTTPDKIDEFWICRVRSLDWIRNRYDNGGLVKPENSERLLEYHPVLGERELWEDSKGKNGTAFKSDSREMAYYRKPARRPVKDDDGNLVKDPQTGAPVLKMDKGRALIMAGDVVLLDGDFLIESKVRPGTFIPRVHLDCAQFDLRSGGEELDGVSLAERMFDPQEDYNELMSMGKDSWQMQAVYKWLVKRGMALDFEMGSGAGGMYVYTGNPTDADDKPEKLKGDVELNAMIPALQHIQGSIARIAHTNEVEGGNPPPGGVWPALALQIMAEQSNEKRKPRLRRIREMLERCFKHGLVLMQELVREPRPLWVEGDNGEEEQIAWEGNMIAGQVNVKIDAEPDVDSDTLQQQTIRDFLQMLGAIGQQQLGSDKRMQRFVAEKMGVPVDELFERSKLQTDCAEREYNEFMREGKEPVVDPELDDHEEHDDCHGIDMMSEKWRELEEAAGWHEAQVWLSDWEQQMAPVPGEPTMVPTEQGPVMQPGPMMPSLLTQVIDMAGLPPAMELRIMAAWTMILGMHQIQVGGDLKRVLRWRAHKAAHKKYAQQQVAAAQMGAPVMAAPSADQTQAGTIPTANTPAQEQGMVQ